MTQREKDAMAREVAEYFEHEERDGLIVGGEYLPPGEKKDIIIYDPEPEVLEQWDKRRGNTTRETRLDSYHAVQPDAAIRRQIILDILTGSEGMTAQEIADELHRRGITPFEERNFAAPRLTELKAAGKIEVTGKKQCYRTGRSVAIWAVKKEV